MGKGCIGRQIDTWLQESLADFELIKIVSKMNVSTFT